MQKRMLMWMLSVMRVQLLISGTTILENIREHQQVFRIPISSSGRIHSGLEPGGCDVEGGGETAAPRDSEKGMRARLLPLLSTSIFL